MEDLKVLFAIVFLLAVIVVIQYSKIKSLETLLKDSDSQKSWAEFETKESQDNSYFQDSVIKELLKEFSPKELERIQSKMRRNIRRISEMEIQDHDKLIEMDIYRLCHRYVVFEVQKRDREQNLSVNN